MKIILTTIAALLGAGLLTAGCQSQTAGHVAAPKPSMTPCADSAELCPVGSQIPQDSSTVDSTDDGDLDIPTPADTPTADTTYHTAALGEPFDIQDQDGNEAQVTALSSKSYSGPVTTDDYSDNKPPQYGRYLSILVRFKVTTGSMDYNEFDYQWQDASGQVFDASNGNTTDSGYDYDKALDSGTLRAGQEAVGYVWFDVARDTGYINYVPGSQAALAGWKVAVK